MIYVGIYGSEPTNLFILVEPENPKILAWAVKMIVDINFGVGYFSSTESLVALLKNMELFPYLH